MDDDLKFDDLSILEAHSQIHREFIIVALQKTFGETLRWRFPNNWGASLVTTSSTQWRPQLMAIRYSDELDTVGHLISDSSVTDTRNGYIDQISVSELVIVLAKIQGLKDDVPK